MSIALHCAPSCIRVLSKARVNNDATTQCHVTSNDSREIASSPPDGELYTLVDPVPERERK
jgi:hypothetical protein